MLWLPWNLSLICPASKTVFFCLVFDVPNVMYLSSVLCFLNNLRGVLKGRLQAPSSQGSYTEYLAYVLVFYVCNNKIPQNGWLNNRNLFFTILESRSPRWRCWQGWFLLRLCPQLTNSSLLLMSSQFPSVDVCVLISSPYKDFSHIRLGPTLTDLI